MIATGGLAAGAVVSALNLACGSLGASIVSGAVAGTIGGATYQLVSSTLSGNDAKTVFQDTLMGGFTGGVFGGFTGGVGFGLGTSTKLGEFGRTVLGGVITGGTGGGVQSLTSSIAAGEDAKTTAWNTVKGIAGGATIGGSAAAIGYGAVKAGSKLLGTGVKACFIAGTLILTAGGLKKIEDIQAGDRVYARDVKSGEEGEKEVLRTFEREVDVLVHLWIDGEEIVTTLTHPFYVDSKGWTDAGKLTEQDNVLAYGERKLRVEGIWIEELSEPVKVYNFEVEEYHTYYVGEAEVLVHNDCGQGNGNEGGKDVWDMTEGGGIKNGREYSQHAMERMAPDTPSVRAELSRRAEALAESKGLQVGTPEYYQFCQKYVDPRNIPPSVVEDAIRNTTAVPGHTVGTFVHQTADVTVIVNDTGKVITVIPK